MNKTSCVLAVLATIAVSAPTVASAEGFSFASAPTGIMTTATAIAGLAPSRSRMASLVPSRRRPC